MAISIELVPDERLLFQGAIYVATVVSANYLLIKPALRLHEERRKRTTGAIDSAKSEEIKANTLESSYQTELRSRTEEAKNLRISEVMAGQSEADIITSGAQDRAKKHLDQIHEELHKNVSQARNEISESVNDVVAAILQKLGAAALLVLVSYAAFFVPVAVASGGGEHLDFMSGIFYPYLQFGFFAAVVYFAGRKPIQNMLDNNRDNLKTRLSEAREAVVLAERKTLEFQKKISTLQKEVEDLRVQYINEGVRERTKIVSDAQRMAEQILRDAQKLGEELVTKSKEDLRKELVEQAIATVEAQLSPDKLRSLDSGLRKEALTGMRALAQNT